MAVDATNSSIVECCLLLGFNVFSRNNRRMNCMHIAAKRGDYDIAVCILEKAREEESESLSSFVNASSHDRSTPLYVAAKFGNMKIMELLLDK